MFCVRYVVCLLVQVLSIRRWSIILLLSAAIPSLVCMCDCSIFSQVMHCYCSCCSFCYSVIFVVVLCGLRLYFLYLCTVMSSSRFLLIFCMIFEFIFGMHIIFACHAVLYSNNLLAFIVRPAQKRELLQIQITQIIFFVIIIVCSISNVLQVLQVLLVCCENRHCTV